MQGKYEVINKEKFMGAKPPRYLSSYELEVFRFLDKNKNVIRWGSENIVVPYENPVKQRKARYYVDIYMEYYDKKGVIHKELIEIKPMNQSKPPVRGKKKQSTYDQESLTYMVNMAKWSAADKYATMHGWVFRILTEQSIFH